MSAAGSKGAPKNPSELKDDTSASREEKKVRGGSSSINCILYEFRLSMSEVWELCTDYLKCINSSKLEISYIN